MYASLVTRGLVRAFTLAVVLFVAVGCGGEETEEEATNVDTSTAPVIEGATTEVTEATTETAEDLADCASGMSSIQGIVAAMEEDVTTRSSRSARRYDVLTQKLKRGFRPSAKHRCVTALAQDSGVLGDHGLMGRFSEQSLRTWFVKIVRWVIAMASGGGIGGGGFGTASGFPGTIITEGVGFGDGTGAGGGFGFGGGDL